MDNQEALRAAVLGSQQQGSPTSPLGNFPELAAMYASSFQVPLSNAATEGQGYNLKVKSANDEAAAAAEAKRQAALADPSNYQQVPKDDGGYAFLDPTGKEISAYDYSRITGKPVDSLLKDSQNPVDIGFNQDWTNLQDYANAKLNSKTDGEAASKAKEIEKQVQELYGVDLGRMEIKDVIKRFQAAYPTVFGGNKAGVKSGQLFIPGSAAAQGGGGIGVQ